MGVLTVCTVGALACLGLGVAACYRQPSALYALTVLALSVSLLLAAELLKGGSLPPGSSPLDLATRVLSRGRRYATVIVHTILEPDGKAEEVEFICPCRRRAPPLLLSGQTRVRELIGRAASFFRCPARVTRLMAVRCTRPSLRPTGAGGAWSGSSGSGVHNDRPVPSGASFDKAVRHLRREQSLAIGFCDQLRLHSLYLQATHGQYSHSGGGDVPADCCCRSAKLEGWKALGDMNPTFARHTLPRILAQVDRNFARRNPKVAPKTPSAQGGASAMAALARRLAQVERHLPENWDKYVAETQAKIGVFAAACTILFYRRTRVTAPGGPRAGLRKLWPMATFWCALVTLYMYILAQGLPPHMHAAIRMRLIRNLQHEHQADAMEPGARLRRRLARYLVPRMSKTLFDTTA